MRRWLFGAAIAGIVSTGIGCHHKRPPAAKLQPQAFYAPAGGAASAAVSATPATAPVAVANAVPANPAPAPAPAPVPASRPSILTASSGSFMTVGTVVGEANGHPVYADKILARIDAALISKAKQLEPAEFRAFAKDLIAKQVMEQITDELEYAAAQRNTTEEEQQIAYAITAQFRQKEVTKAGGSVAVARAKAAEDGIDFDEKINEEYRRNLIRLYYGKKVWPKVQVSAQDMRRYYEVNREAMFTEKAAVRFRVIYIDFKKTGATDPKDATKLAWNKMQGLYEKAKRGDDFAVLAAADNDNAIWKRNRGYMDMTDKFDENGQPLLTQTGQPVKEGAWLQKGSLRQEELEKAVFSLNPGELTSILDLGEGLYLAKVEEKKTGRVRAFEEDAVQTDIRERMEREQRMALRRKEQKKLLDAAYTRTDEKALDVAVDMAMQKYAMWAKN